MKMAPRTKSNGGILRCARFDAYMRWIYHLPPFYPSSFLWERAWVVALSHYRRSELLRLLSFRPLGLTMS